MSEVAAHFRRAGEVLVPVPLWIENAHAIVESQMAQLTAIFNEVPESDHLSFIRDILREGATDSHSNELVHVEWCLAARQAAALLPPSGHFGEWQGHRNRAIEDAWFALDLLASPMVSSETLKPDSQAAIGLVDFLWRSRPTFPPGIVRLWIHGCLASTLSTRLGIQLENTASLLDAITLLSFVADDCSEPDQLWLETTPPVTELLMKVQPAGWNSKRLKNARAAVPPALEWLQDQLVAIPGEGLRCYAGLHFGKFGGNWHAFIGTSMATALIVEIDRTLTRDPQFGKDEYGRNHGSLLQDPKVNGNYLAARGKLLEQLTDSCLDDLAAGSREATTCSNVRMMKGFVTLGEIDSVWMLNKLLCLVIECKASGIHITTSATPVLDTKGRPTGRWNKVGEGITQLQGIRDNWSQSTSAVDDFTGQELSREKCERITKSFASPVQASLLLTLGEPGYLNSLPSELGPDTAKAGLLSNPVICMSISDFTVLVRALRPMPFSMYMLWRSWIERHAPGAFSDELHYLGAFLAGDLCLPLYLTTGSATAPSVRSIGRSPRRSIRGASYGQISALAGFRDERLYERLRGRHEAKIESFLANRTMLTTVMIHNTFSRRMEAPDISAGEFVALAAALLSLSVTHAHLGVFDGKLVPTEDALGYRRFHFGIYLVGPAHASEALVLVHADESNLVPAPPTLRQHSTVDVNVNTGDVTVNLVGHDAPSDQEVVESLIRTDGGRDWNEWFEETDDGSASTLPHPTARNWFRLLLGPS